MIIKQQFIYFVALSLPTYSHDANLAIPNLSLIFSYYLLGIVITILGGHKMDGNICTNSEPKKNLL
jgi:hypothetical protein